MDIWMIAEAAKKPDGGGVLMVFLIGVGMLYLLGKMFGNGSSSSSSHQQRQDRAREHAARRDIERRDDARRDAGY